MKIIIFAGGVGTRLWPLSRQNSPKQFDKIFNGQSTIELAVERVAPVFGLANIYIQTTANFKSVIKKQIKKLPSKNIITEPSRKNNGPAVCLGLQKLKQTGYSGPVAIIWADHLMEKVEEFQNNLKTAEQLINDNPNRFIFLAEHPRFANNNLGWIHISNKIGEIDNVNYYKFSGWQYKPEQTECDKMFKSGDYFWNPGYFISSLDFLLQEYQKLAPEIFNCTKQTISSKSKAKKKINYDKCPKESFDNCLIAKTDLQDAIVLKTNLGWSDPGTLYALKEALAQSQDDNITAGQVYNLDSKDCLVYNLEKKKLITTIGLNGMVIVNTPDAIIIAPKDKVKQITELTEKLKAEGLAKYL